MSISRPTQHSDVPLHELSYNEIRITRQLLEAERDRLTSVITCAQYDLEFIEDMLERTDPDLTEDK